MAGIGAVLYVTVFMVIRLFDKSYAAGTGRLLEGDSPPTSTSSNLHCKSVNHVLLLCI
jgi:hypothetical protein